MQKYVKNGCPRNFLVYSKCSKPSHFLPISLTSLHDSLKFRLKGHPCDDKLDFSYCESLTDGLTTAWRGVMLYTTCRWHCLLLLPHPMPLSCREQSQGCLSMLSKLSHSERPRRTSKILTTCTE